MRGRSGIVLVGLALLAAPARADDFPVPAIPCAPRQYVCRRAPAPLVVDGALDEAAWRDAAWTEPFVDIEGPAKPAPRFLTRAKLLWDDDNLYVGAELEEPDLWATLTERDAVIFHDNDFELFIDPDGDTHEYYELEINALATVWDLLLIRPYRDGGPAVNAWDIAGLRAAVRLDGTLNDPSDRDRGWTVELALPWSVLRECAHREAPPRDGDRWRLNFSRVEWRTRVDGGGYANVVDPATGRPLPEDNWVWSPQGLIAMHYPEMWGIVQFSALPAGAAPVAPRDDPADATRWTLRRIYYAQKRFHLAHGRFATALADLGLADPAASGGAAAPVIEATTDRFEARAGSAPDGPLLGIDEEGRLRTVAGVRGR
ncbi:MAG: carbohydrate-binding family 9-like protein [Candidatus Krumholzibacteriia bacterium]